VGKLSWGCWSASCRQTQAWPCGSCKSTHACPCMSPCLGRAHSSHQPHLKGHLLLKALPALRQNIHSSVPATFTSLCSTLLHILLAILWGPWGQGLCFLFLYISRIQNRSWHIIIHGWIPDELENKLLDTKNINGISILWVERNQDMWTSMWN
jgi:hypothetical protein